MRVCRFDELSDGAKDRLVEIADGEIVAGVDPDVATELVQYDLITFVEYYDVRLTDPWASGSVSAWRLRAARERLRRRTPDRGAGALRHGVSVVDSPPKVDDGVAGGGR